MNLRDWSSLPHKSLLTPDPDCFAVFNQPCLCFSVFFLAHFQEFFNPVTNLSLKNNSYKNTGFPISVRIGGKKLG